MIKVTRTFRKKSEKLKEYKKGKTCEFDKATEKDLVKRGFAEFIHLDNEKVEKKPSQTKSEK